MVIIQVQGGSKMKIIAADLYVVKLPFRFAFKHSLASRNYSENIILRLVVENGSLQISGFGEGIPRSYVTGESIASSLAILKDQFLPRFLQREFVRYEDLKQAIESEFAALKLAEKSYGAAWCALELALLDAAGQVFGKNLTAMLSGSRQAHPDRSIRYGGVVPLGGRVALTAILSFYKSFGFQTVKLKVGNDLEDDLGALRLARRILGQSVVLRVDANCAWTLEQALAAAQRMRQFNVSSIEQPLPATDLEGLAKLTKSVPEEIVADESLCTIVQARQLAANKIVSGFNIRISKVGGVLAAQRIAQIARQSGIAVHLGAQVGESGILSAAARAFALSEDPFANYEGSNSFFLLQSDLTKENLNVGFGGIGKPLSGNGLGVNVVPSILKKLTVQEQTVAATIDSQDKASAPLVKK